MQSWFKTNPALAQPRLASTSCTTTRESCSPSSASPCKMLWLTRRLDAGIRFQTSTPLRGCDSTRLKYADLNVPTLQAILAVFRGLKKCPGPPSRNMWRLSAHEFCKSLLLFFDTGEHWPNGLHSQIPACSDWALKNGKALVKLVSRILKE